MCRCCPVPGCVALLAMGNPFCDRHWSKLPIAIVDEMYRCDRLISSAADPDTKRRAEIEYKAAWDMAVGIAAQRAVRNMGRVGEGVRG